jgi:ATP-dependent Lhr-like helicase
VRKDEVLVAQATPEGAAPPFWKGDSAGRGLQTGIAFGKLMRGLSDSRKQQGPGLLAALRKLGLDEAAAEGARGFLERQLKATGVLPEDRVIIVEHFRDEAGDRQVMVHTLFGRQVNAPLALLAREEARRAGVDMDVFDDDDGFLLFPRDGRALPGDLLRGLAPAGARQTLEAILPATALFGMAFRYNAARALMMGAQSAGRHPLWIQRLRGAEMLDAAISQENHPLIIETRRECMEDYWDMEGTEWVLTQIQRGDIRIHEVFLEAPSPMSLTLRRAAEAALMYEYSPVAAGVQAHTAQALAGLEEARIAPAPAQLVRVSERTRLPENEQQLHSLLMAEGDLLAGEADVPAAWLEKLAREGRVLYIDPGLWIAAEHGEEYAAALEAGDEAAREHIVRRALRYRGFQSAAQIAERYFWPEDSAVSVLAALCARKSVVEADGIYYHESLYARAQRETVKERRRQIKTQPPERYAALLARRTRKSAAPDEQLKAALTSLAGAAFPASLWESVLLPARAPAYRPAMLDAVLAEGGFCWRMEEGGALSFFLREDIDWDAEIPAGGRDSEAEAFVCDALMKRGASFIQNIPSPPGGAPVWDILISLAEKGVVCADSFVPVRHWLKREDVAKTAARQRVGARVMAMNAGRWELMRPIRGRSIEDGIERAFGRAVLLCRETARECGVPWQAALEKLRLWEYTGRVRRGYFIEGLSGAQFLLGTEFESVVFALENPRDEILWLMASDPAQPWGKYLPHRESRGFLNVAGTAVALRGGLPVAALERQGQALRVFDWGSLSEAMGAFTREFAAGRVFAALRRIKLSKYPDMAAETLSAAGFRREMLDYVLYRE